jgi:NADH-ubiquinone oxidoreductase chain 5
MYLTIITLPLLAAIASGFLGRKIGTAGSHIVCSLTITLTLVLSLVAFYEVGFASSPVSISVGCWLESELLYLSWGFLFDPLAVSMLLPVLIVSTLVILYSVGYMKGDPHQQRFFAYLSMFTFCMILLVTGDNYAILFIGWECVGITSYLLISFWYTRVQATKSAIQAIVMNRIGDWGLLIGLFGLFWLAGALDYSATFSITSIAHSDMVTMIGLGFLIGAMGKSAQIGLHVWLPQAMEGPTPVSALLHSATMVAAGIFLLLRISPLLEYSDTVLVQAIWIGSLTALFAATTGLFQNDLKRVIAYSTCSQLGMLLVDCGLTKGL